jgi:putative acetyltransferase
VDLVIGPEDPGGPDVRRLLAAHLAFARGSTPPEHVHALGSDGLSQTGIVLFGARRDGRLLGVGALRHLDLGHAEIKSMHTSRTARRQGIGRAILDHLLTEAKRRGYRRVSLETGTMEVFAPARALYEERGFRRCPPFGEYGDNPFSVCMTLALDGSDAADVPDGG